MELKPCRWRGPESNGRFPCRSPKIMAPNGVNASLCAGCSLRDHPPPRGPSLFRRAWNFIRALIQHVRDGMRKAPPSEIRRRLALCESCHLFNATDRTCTHKSCGCMIDRKCPWRDQRCPVGRW